MSKAQYISVIGNGSWGTALAIVWAKKGHPVTIWGHNTEYLKECEAARENTRYLPKHRLPDAISFQPDIAAAFEGSDVVVDAVPTRHLRAVFSGLKDSYPAQTPLVSLSKGIEKETLKFPSQILAEETGAETVAVLSGPTMAEEVVRGLPASVTLAHKKLRVAQELQHAFSTQSLRVYASDDPVGVELAGAAKNVIAIAAGLCDGMGLGDNAKAALMARGLNELRGLGRALGARDETFSGLSGVGDLYTTCASPYGRNRGFGERLGKGLSIEEAQDASQGMIVEGVDTAASIHQLARSEGVELPICEAVYSILYQEVAPRDALNELMSRDLKVEG